MLVVQGSRYVLQSTQTHATVDEAVEAAKEMLNELIQMLDELASADGIVTNMIDVISKAIDRVCT